MVHCIAFGCNNKDADVKRGISFFRLPKSAKMRSAWLSRLKLQNPPVSDNVRVCSDHFTAEDMNEDMQASMGFKKSVRRLKHDAVPSVFVFSKKSAPRETSAKRAERFAKKQVGQATHGFIHNL